jgi:hypothetical protein
MGWNPKVRDVRGFSCIYIEDVSLSIFVSENMLFVVKGDKLPPVVYKENIDKPDFDIIEAIGNVCNKIFTSPEKL